MSTEKFVWCGLGLLRAEEAESVLDAVLSLVLEAADMWSPTQLRETLLAQVAALSYELAGGDGALNDDARLPANGRQLIALRGLARTTVTNRYFGLLETAARNDVDLRWRVLERRACRGDLDERDIEATLSVDPDPDGWLRELVVRCAYPSEEAKESAWRAVMTSKVPTGSIRRVAAAFWQRSQDSLLEKYASSYLGGLPDISRAGMIAAMALAGGMFPFAGVDYQFLDQVDRAMGSADVSALVKRAVGEQADILRRMLYARSPNC